MTEFKEQFRLTLSNAGKVRNRCEAHMVKYAQELLSEPVALTIEQVYAILFNQLAYHVEQNPSHGFCNLSNISVSSRISGHHNRVTRSFGIYGRGRGIYTLAIVETVRKDADNNYEPLQPLRS